MNATICDAINQKLVLEFYYDGMFRQVEAFCYGLGTSGNELLRAYQIGGYSKSGNPYGWKLFEVNKMTFVTLSVTQHIGIRYDYKPNDSAMQVIFAYI
jgi:hypothetical protein